MNSKKILLLVSIIVLSSVAAYAYYQFNLANFQNIKQNTNQKDTSSNKAFSKFPVPEGYVELTSNENSNGGQLTLQTNENLSSAAGFYKTVLIADGWTLKEESSMSSTYTMKFDKANEEILLNAVKEVSSNTTILNIEYTRD